MPRYFMADHFISSSAKLDSMAIIMILLATYLGLCVGFFSVRYMRGDRMYKKFFQNLVGIVIAVTAMVSVNNIFLFLLAYCCSNFLLVRLMVHKREWNAAKASGLLAARNHIFSALFMLLAFLIFYRHLGTANISIITPKNAGSLPMIVALLFIILSAMMQSAIWPFNRWLLSSLNSPTPVSAIMHAGLINGGGFLLIRFAPLYLQINTLLNIIFLIGLISAVWGTLLKLIQTDVKRMLACSTMGQMGFMFMQCGLGLFPAAVAHLVWHSMFKAYLFLASGSAAQEKSIDLSSDLYGQDSPQIGGRLFNLILIITSGFAGSIGFALASGKSWLILDSTMVLLVVSFIASCQFSAPLAGIRGLKKVPITLIVTTLFGGLYGCSVNLIYSFMKTMEIMQPQPLNAFHVVGIAVMMLSSLTILYVKESETLKNRMSTWAIKIYVKALNAGQPHTKTITAHRNYYKF